MRHNCKNKMSTQKCTGFINIFSGRATIDRTSLYKKTFLYRVKPRRQNCPHGQSSYPVPHPSRNP